MLDINSGGQSVIANNLLAEIKVVNAAPQTGAISMLLDDLPVGRVRRLPDRDVLLRRVLAGTHTLTFEASGTPGATIATLPNIAGEASDQSIFLMGFSGALKAVALTDNNLPPLSGNVRLRFVNASPDAPPVGCVDQCNNAVHRAGVGTGVGICAAARRHRDDHVHRSRDRSDGPHAFQRGPDRRTDVHRLHHGTGRGRWAASSRWTY